MPAKDLFHDNVKNALIKDGWTITHDPLVIRMSKKRLYVDLGAERVIAAERDTEKIAVEVKGFTKASDMQALEEALGQCILYSRLLSRYDPDRKVYLAVPDPVYESVFEEEVGQILIEDGLLSLVTFDITQEKLIRWIP
ncbi:MAG: XisH family protein [Cyanobacteria bacterium J06634_5]